MSKVPDPLSTSNGGRPAKPGRLARVAAAARGILCGRRARIGRRILIVNLVALNTLVLGILYLGGSHETLLRQRGDSVLQSASLLSGMVAARLPDAAENAPLAAAVEGADIPALLQAIPLRAGTGVWLFDRDGRLLARRDGDTATALPRPEAGPTPVMDGLMHIRAWLRFGTRDATPPQAPRAATQTARGLVDAALANGPHSLTTQGPGLWAAAPVVVGSSPAAVLAISDAPGALDGLIRAERERVLQIFLVALLLSVGLSVMLARAISTPLADLALAAETGRDGAADPRDPEAGRIRIPDLSRRPDEIGRLSDSVQGMVAALYQRIENTEQFAADVAHEIKNPLTSLHCAVGTMRETTRADQRARLLDVIEHDVRRLDRLIGDISSASRLDSDLVRQKQAPFDLLEMLRNLGQSLDMQAAKKEVTLSTDFPDQPIIVAGLEARLAQVFVNLVINAISFCGPGDGIRIRARRRAEQVLVMVEDTGPGVPEGALEKIFQRFYSNRPESEFGDHSGLGLAISRQIVEAHDGVIWAENIRPAGGDATSQPLGMRVVVGLSV